MSARPDAAATEQFLNALWPDPEQSGQLIVWAHPSRATRSYPLTELHRAASDAAGLAHRENVYIGCALQAAAPPAGSRGTAETVCAMPGVWVDLDVQGAAHAATDLPPDLDAACDLLAEAPHNPSVIVDSGHGLQAWWLFREPWQLADAPERERAAELVRGWQALLQAKAQAHGWRLDATHDLARVLRPAGTLNHKLEPRPVRFLLNDAARYNPDELRECCPVAAPRASCNGTAPPVDSVIPSGQRNSTLASLAGSMRRPGMAEPEIAAALLEVNARRCVPPLPDDEVRSIATSIARYAPAVELGRERATYDGPPAAFDQTLEVFRRWLHLPDAAPVYAVLGAVAANRLDGDPVWLGAVAPPSSMKTELLNSLSLQPDVYPVGTLTPAALLSGTPKRDKAANAKGGLLRELGDFGIVVCKDFGSILSLRPDAKAEVLAALREIYDGAWTRCLGTDGGQTLTWHGKVGLVFGATPVLDSHHAVMGAMGERFVLVRLDAADEAQAMAALDHAGARTAIMRQELAEAVAALFAGAKSEARALSDQEKRELVRLAALAVRIRSTVERDRNSREIESIHGAEGPARLALTLERLLAGLDVLGVARETAFGIVRRVAMDSVPPLRRRAYEYLRDQGAPVETKTVAETLGLPTNTTRRVLEDLAAYRLVLRAGSQGKADVWSAAA